LKERENIEGKRLSCDRREKAGRWEEVMRLGKRVTGAID
jgi:hypothetical protein